LFTNHQINISPDQPSYDTTIKEAVGDRFIFTTKKRQERSFRLPFTHIISTHLSGCPVEGFPIKYLGVPLHYDNMRRDDIQPLVDKMLKRIAGWRGKLLSLAARLTLVKSCLASVLVYLLSFIKFSKRTLKILATHMANCLWNDQEDQHKIHWANWEALACVNSMGV
jgi:hypothetical protein